MLSEVKDTQIDDNLDDLTIKLPNFEKNNIKEWFNLMSMYDKSIPGEKWKRVSHQQIIKCVGVNSKGFKQFEVIDIILNFKGDIIRQKSFIDLSKYSELCIKIAVNKYYSSLKDLVYKNLECSFMTLAGILAKEQQGIVERKEINFYIEDISTNETSLYLENYMKKY